VRKINLLKRLKNKFLLLVPISIVLIIILVNLYIETGIFQESKLDSRDLQHWKYEGDFISGAQGFSISGNNETCWLLLHSYTSTPAEMKELANKINSELNQTVIVPVLEGHSQIPSKLNGKNITTWYNQANLEYNSMKKSCEKINILGSSLSSSIALKIAEENELNKVFVVNSFIYLPYEAKRIFSLRTYINVLTPIVHYNKKLQLAQINSEQGLKEHISYWNMPYPPIKSSFSFIDETIENTNKIDEPIFIAHSENDPTAGVKSALSIYNGVNSKVKELKWYNNSSHVLLMDYDKEYLIEEIIKFEKEN